MKEIEIKFLDVNVEEIREKLLQLGAKNILDEMLEEWIFIKPEWDDFLGRVRIRKSGSKVELAYKETTQDTSKGNLEIEFEVSDVEAAKALLVKLNIPQVRHQEKKRETYLLGNVTVDIDFWPKIPPYIEIEGLNLKDLEEVAGKLGLNPNDSVNLDAKQIYLDIYKIDINKITELVF